ncbi:hypothetical protein ACEPAG_4089 [Sanghuangporus baumii]
MSNKDIRVSTAASSSKTSSDEVDEPSGPDTKSTSSGADRGGRLLLKDEARSEPIYGDLKIVTHDTLGFAERDLGIHGGLIPDEAYSQIGATGRMKSSKIAHIYILRILTTCGILTLSNIAGRRSGCERRTQTIASSNLYISKQLSHCWLDLEVDFRFFLRRKESLYGGYCKEYAKDKWPVGIMLADAWFLWISLVETEVAVPPISGKSDALWLCEMCEEWVSCLVVSHMRRRMRRRLNQCIITIFLDISSVEMASGCRSST